MVLEDMTKALVSFDQTGALEPISNLKAASKLGLFVGGNSEDIFRVCNEGKVSLWVEGRLLSVIEGACETYPIQDLAKIAKADTFYLHFYSTTGLENLQVDRIAIFIEKDDQGIWGLKRSVRDPYKEYLIIGLIFLLAAFGFLAVRFPNRIKYLYSRAFSLKESSYELVEVEFFNSAGWSFAIFLALVLGFFWVGFTQGPRDVLVVESTLGSLSLQWLKTSGVILLLLLGKWILASIISSLFSTAKIYEYQVFDFINVSLSLGFVLLILFYGNFIFDLTFLRGQTNEIHVFVVLLLIISSLFLALKFVSNYPHKKLLIITYLCATEIFPAIILIGWFYK